MKPLEMQYNTLCDSDGNVNAQQLSVPKTLQAIIDRVNEQQKFMDILSKEIDVLNGMDD